MVCNRCVIMVRSVLQELELDVCEVSLGEATLNHPITSFDKQKIVEVLTPLGFELIDDKRSRIIEKIKIIIIDLAHYQNSELKENLSDLLSRKLNHDYSYLSNLISDVEGTTIEKYFIAQKIEKVKELLVYDELTLSEIADQLNYSSVAYLSNQFKKVTGLTPSHFKKIKENRRTPLDKV